MWADIYTDVLNTYRYQAAIAMKRIERDLAELDARNAESARVEEDRRRNFIDMRETAGLGA